MSASSDIRLQSAFGEGRRSGDGLGQRAVRAGFWVFGIRITSRLLGSVRMIVLARLLAPEDLGLMGIALLAASALETFSQTGFDAALIQQRERTYSYLDTSWTAQVIRGVLLFGILLTCAPFVSAFFNAPEAAAIVRAIAVAELLEGFTNIGIIHFKKELEFNKQFVFESSATLADLVVTVSLAFILRNVWALVFGLLAGKAAHCIASYVIHPYRPHPAFDRRQLRELLGFGKWVFGSSVLVFLLTQGDDALVGKLLGASTLAFYQVAYRISNLPATEITHVIFQVAFPAYSKLQDNIPKLRSAFLAALQITALLSIPLAGLTFVLALPLTTILLGEKWLPIVEAMQVLSLFGVLRSIGASLGAIALATGQPQIETKISVVQLSLLAAIIYPLTRRWGILGTSWATIVPMIVSVVSLVFATKRILHFRYQDLLLRLFIPLSAVVAMAFVILVFQKLLLPSMTFLSLLFLLVLGGSVYAVFLLLLSRLFGCNMHRIPPLVQRTWKQ